MGKKRYKDLIATLILIGIVGFIYGAYLFGRYGTEEQKMLFVECLFALMFLIGVWAVWKLIRAILD